MNSAEVRSRGVGNKAKYVVQSTLAKGEFGVGIEDVKEIRTWASVPVQGLFTLRGVTVPVLDLRRYFAPGRAAQNKQSRILLVQLGGNLTGLLVDKSSRIVMLSGQSIKPYTGRCLSVLPAEFLLGTSTSTGTSRTIVIVNVRRVRAGSIGTAARKSG